MLLAVRPPQLAALLENSVPPQMLPMSTPAQLAFTKEAPKTLAKLVLLALPVPLLQQPLAMQDRIPYNIKQLVRYARLAFPAPLQQHYLLHVHLDHTHPLQAQQVALNAQQEITARAQLWDQPPVLRATPQQQEPLHAQLALRATSVLEESQLWLAMLAFTLYQKRQFASKIAFQEQTVTLPTRPTWVSYAEVGIIPIRLVRVLVPKPRSENTLRNLLAHQ